MSTRLTGDKHATCLEEPDLFSSRPSMSSLKGRHLRRLARDVRRRARARSVLLALAILAGSLAGCPKPSDEGGLCSEDSDCAAGTTCLFDVDRATTYCTSTCERDVDCPLHQFCSTGFDSVLSESTELRVCVDRVRSCDPASAPAETCNGLDDDCDNAIDGAGCTPITGCLDDAPCGAFVCQTPRPATEAVCMPKNTNATTRYGDTCTSGNECENNDCTTGQCLPSCRPLDMRACSGLENYCARVVGPLDQPPRNVCYRQCEDQRDCEAPQACVWRDVYFGPGATQNGKVHVPVCSIPGPERKGLGEACPRNDPAGDDECSHGLCFGFVCTKLCNGLGGDCSDVGPDFICRPTVIRYGELEFMEDICVRRQE